MVSQDDLPYLSYLIRLGVTTIPLKVYTFGYTVLPEDVVIASCSLDETQAQ